MPYRTAACASRASQVKCRAAIDKLQKSDHSERMRPFGSLAAFLGVWCAAVLTVVNRTVHVRGFLYAAIAVAIVGFLLESRPDGD